ncbi:MAG: hypothetical protein K4571_06095, partial [Deltaproteobacteria bacterium]
MSRGITAEANPEMSIGNLLQMFKAAGLDKITANGNNVAGGSNNTENGNKFFQVLQEHVAALLQSEQPSIAPETTSKQDLSLVLEKLLQGDKSAADEILSELALLGINGKPEGRVDDKSKVPGETFIRFIPSSETPEKSNLNPVTGRPYIVGNISGPEGFSNPHIDPTTGKPYVNANISGPEGFSNPHIDPTTGKPYVTANISGPGS